MRAKVSGLKENPFDTHRVRLFGHFTGPDERSLKVLGFYTQEYTRSLDEGKEKIKRKGDPHWAVRFSPPVAGDWQCEGGTE